MKVTLFLGAGFSAPFGHPVMNEFLAFADETKHIDQGEKAFLGELVLEARRANSFLESSPTNLEDIVSFAVMADRIELGSGAPRAPRIREILRKIYGQTADLRTYWQVCSRFCECFGLKRDETWKDLTIITTNYDLNADCALYYGGNPAKLPFVPEYIGQTTKQVNSYLYADRGVPLCKLHGSVNWFTNTNADHCLVDAAVGNVMEVSGKKLESIPCPLTYDASYTPHGDAMIVPPSFLKPDLSPELASAWTTAAKALQESHLLVFVGYSFPQSDTEMAYFLSRALAGNSHLRNILIVDPEADAIVHRLKSAESPYGSHFRALLKRRAADWTLIKVDFSNPAGEKNH